MQKVVDFKNVRTDVFYPSAYWKISSDILGVLEMHAVMSHEWCVEYAFKTGWKSIDSPFALVDEVLTKVIMYKML